MRRALAVLLAGTFLLTASARTSAAELAVTLRDSRGLPVADAVVSLTPLDAAPAAPAEGGAPVEIAQEDQEYVPYVTAVRVGTQVNFPNKDNIQHHLYSVSKPKRFEKPLYASGAHESVTFDQPGVVTLGCNIHDWMIGYVVVLETPHFAKSDQGGAAALDGLAPGRYRLEIWHPRLAKPVAQEIGVPSSAPVSFSLSLKPDRRIRRAPDGKTGGY